MGVTLGISRGRGWEIFYFFRRGVGSLGWGFLVGSLDIGRCSFVFE